MTSQDSKRLGWFDATALFGLVRNHQRTSYSLSELSNMTGRARSTVVPRLDELLEAGLVALLDLAGEIDAETTFDARMADGPGFVLDAAIAAVRVWTRGAGQTMA